MSLSITRSRVKEKCGITDTSLDTSIDNLIAELGPAIEYSIRPEHIADTGNAGLQATLNLGATEIVCAEILAQILRPAGAAESISIAGLSLGPVKDAEDRDGLRAQGAARLAPYLKTNPSATSGTSVRAAGRPEEANP